LPRRFLHGETIALSVSHNLDIGSILGRVWQDFLPLHFVTSI
jgi:hypothetical protein